jgi:hypothetical protein
VNETDLIVRAMKMSTPKKHRKIIPEIEPSLINTTNDAISRMASRAIRKKRSKPLKSWEAPEFLQYLIQALSNYSVRLARVSARDREDMAYIYDELVRRVNDDMSNIVMRDYIDWWSSTYARKMYGEELYVRQLGNDHYVDQFVNIKFNRSTNISVPENKSPADQTVDAQILYQMGGLPMLLRSKGIVVAANILRDKGDTNWLMRLSQTLHDFPKEAVCDTMLHTISGAPYLPECMVDFVSVARPALEYHRVRDFVGLNYRQYFKEQE